MKSTENRDLKRLEAELRLVEDQQAITQTLYRYTHSIDYGKVKDWADCFTEDGVFEAQRKAGHPSWRVQGRAGLARWLTSEFAVRTGINKCPSLAPRITLKGDRATVVSYMVRLDEEAGIPYLRNFGRYFDDMVRCPDGMWRIKKRVAEVEASHTVYPYEKRLLASYVPEEWNLPAKGKKKSSA